MSRIFLIGVLCLALEAVGGEPITPPIEPRALERFLVQAKDLAVEKTEGINHADLINGYLTPYYASRMTNVPGGSLVSFTVRGSQRKEELGEKEDRILVIFPDGREPEVERITIWLKEGIRARAR